MRFDNDTLMHHGTAAPAFGEFHNHLPTFFTSRKEYAEVYAGKGGGRTRIITARLDVRHPFVGDVPEDVAFYNDGFVPWLLSQDPLYREVRPIALRPGVPFIWANEFFVHLRRTARAGTSPYDGFVVDETPTAVGVGGDGVTVVPLWPSQIGIVSEIDVIG